MRRPAALVGLLLVGSVALAGCGGSDGPTSPGTAATTATPTTSSGAVAGGSGGGGDSAPNASTSAAPGTGSGAVPPASSPASPVPPSTTAPPAGAETTSGGGASSAPSPASSTTGAAGVALPAAGTTALRQTGTERFRTPLGDADRALPPTATLTTTGSGATRRVVIAYSADRSDTFDLRRRADGAVVLTGSTTFVRFMGFATRQVLAPTTPFVLLPADPRTGATAGGPFTAEGSGGTYRTTVLAASSTALTTRFVATLTSGPARGTTSVTLGVDRRTGAVRSVVVAVDATTDGSTYTQSARLAR